MSLTRNARNLPVLSISDNFSPIELKTLLALDQDVNGLKPKSPHYTITMPRYYTHGKITNMKNVKALIFDVFGTVVDWRTSVIDECLELAKANNIHADWGQFADAWRAKYGPFMNKVRTKELPWTNLDRLHRMALDELLSEFHINTLSEDDKHQLNLCWHRLHPWPDSVSGLTQLKKHFLIAPLSNGNLALLPNMAKNAGLPWDCILSAELAKAYKPDPDVYKMAVNLLGLQPNQVVMVAAHQGDLRAAKKIGLKTAFIPRPLEHGPQSNPDLKPDPDFDIVASSLDDLAKKMASQFTHTQGSNATSI